MPDNDLQTPAPVADQNKTPEPTGPGKKPVSILGIVALGAYLILLSILLLQGTVQLLKVNPSVQPQNSTTNTETAVKDGIATHQKEEVTWQVRFWLLREVTVSKELQLILIVIFAGALGALVHALRSLSWYVGNRQLMASWIAMYGLLPFMGSSLAVIFYLVIRGGFFSAQSGSEPVSLFGFAALAGLVGMFSEQAILKLKSIAETLFTKGEKGAGHVGPEGATSPLPQTGDNASGAKPDDSKRTGAPAPAPAEVQTDAAAQQPPAKS